MMEKRLADIILKVTRLKDDKETLEMQVAELTHQIEALKVALDQSNKKNKTHVTQIGDEDQRSQVTNTSIADAKTEQNNGQSSIDTAQLKMQIANAIEDIDQCIQIISVDK
jgi:regulator of replication initiation timing